MLSFMLMLTAARAQGDLSTISAPGASRSQGRDIKKECIPTWMFQVTYAFQVPMMDDTKELFGNNHTVGGSVYYKTNKNWLFSFNGNYISGNKVNISRSDLFGEILDLNGEIITGDGIYGSYALFERGVHLQLTGGKMFAFKKPNPNSGIFVQGGLGYIVSWIRTEFGSYASPPKPLNDDYRYGYDRKRGGFAYSASVGYLFLSSTRIFNFSVAVEYVGAITMPMREWDFNLRAKDTKVYNDGYFGIRAAIYIPTYKRMPAEYYYY